MGISGSQVANKTQGRFKPVRKFLVSLMVALLLLGTFGTAFAASFPDTEGTKYEDAVNILSSLGLLRGYPDGTFKPANTITRAEFAAMVVRALGLEAAAEITTGFTPFSDVDATHWAAGYINVAADQGIINGYPDGTFRPDAPVTYAESLAMIIRMLGYDPVVQGTWPTGYLVKGYELGIPAGVSFQANSPAPRGDIAVFFNNSLTVNLMEKVYSGALATYAVTEKTILEDKLGCTFASGYVTEVDSMFGSALEAGQVMIDGDLYTVGGELDFSDWLGQKVEIWYSSATDEVIAAQCVEGDMVSGVIADIAEDGDSVTIGEDVYYTASGWFATANNESVDESAITANDADFVGAEVRALLDAEGDIVSLIAMKYDHSLFLTDITARYNRFTGNAESALDMRFDLDDYDEVVILKDGAAADIDDLEVGDIARYFESGSDFYMEVSSESVSGELEALEIDADERMVLTIDGDEYVLAAEATYSVDENDSFVEYTAETDLMPFIGEEITAHLAADGTVRHVSGAVEAPTAAADVGLVATEFYAVTNPDPTEADAYYVKVFLADGTTTKLQFTGDTLFDGATHDPATQLAALNTAYAEGTLVTFSLDSDGYLATMDAVPVATNAAFAVTDINDDNNLVDGRRVTGGTVFFVIDTSGAYAWAVRDWDVFQTISFSGSLSADEAADGSLLEYLVLDRNGASVAYGETSILSGIVTSRGVTASGPRVDILTLDANGNPVEVTYAVARDVTGVADTAIAAYYGQNSGAGSSALTDLDIGDYVTFEVDGEYFVSIDEEAADEAYTGSYTGYVAGFSSASMVLTIQDDLENPGLDPAPEYILALDCLVFDVTGAPALADADDIQAEQEVMLFDLDGNDIVDIVLIVAE